VRGVDGEYIARSRIALLISTSRSIAECRSATAHPGVSAITRYCGSKRLAHAQARRIWFLTSIDLMPDEFVERHHADWPPC
jgi:hypothetical protein